MSAVLHCGDCRDVMASMDTESVHAIATDPPYGLGFMGRGWDRGVPGKEFWEAALRVAKPGAHLVAFSGSRTVHHLMHAIESAGWEIRDSLIWMYGQGFPKSHNLGGEWDGYGTALKPAYEPIILARKPLEGTVAKNMLEHGCGALAIDACRINPGELVSGGGNGQASNGGRFGAGEARGTRPLVEPHSNGRWPANVVLGCACEVEHEPECAVALLDAQSGDETGAHGRGEQQYAENPRVAYGKSLRTVSPVARSAGGASRFFYVAKATRAEREAGLEHRVRRKVNDGREKPIDNAYQRAETLRANTHPTVKPVSLMRWLVRLVGGKRGSLVLDPFMGSGTTGIACALEGFRFVGIDLEQEHVDIARARILAAQEEAGTAAADDLAAVPDRGGPVQLGLLADRSEA